MASPFPTENESRPARPLTEEEIKGVIAQEISNALGSLGSEISEERRRAIQFYYGRPMGNEIEGRSSVVLTDVTDTIEWTMPALMRMFTSGTVVVRYMGKKEEDDEGARQATDYINHVFLNELDGFSILYEWFKTALLEKNGFTKAYVEERREPRIDTYQGIDEEQLAGLLSEEGVEPVALDEYEETMWSDEAGGPITAKFYDVRLRVWRSDKRIKVDGVPPEEFLNARRMIELDQYAPFTAHRKKVTVSDLIAMGYDPEVVMDLPSDDMPEYTQGRTERLSEDETFPVTTAERADAASREIWLTECYIRIDEDGDGYAELRRIIVVGEQSITILSDEEINWMPFASLCPIPVPHKFIGLSVADLVMDLQVIRSTLLRQMLDNLYLTNNTRVAVVEGNVQVDDLLVSRPGGIVRQSAPGMIEPLNVQPLGPMAYNTLEFLEAVRENRTGITRYNQGLDASSLNQTASGINSIMNAAQARVELIARIFSQTGLKQLFRLLLRLYVEGGFRQQTMRLNDKWVQVDPATWNADMDVEIEVGLGVGQSQERVGFLGQMLQVQAGMVERGLGYMVPPEKIYNAVSKLTEAMGFRRPDAFVADPKTLQPPEPPPDPQMIENQQEFEIEKLKLQLKQGELENETAKDGAIADFRVQELQETMILEREKIESNERIAAAEIESKERIERTKAEAQKEAAKAKEETTEEEGEG